jgi:hypothetical protein
MSMKRAHSTNLWFDASASKTALVHIVMTNDAASTGYVDVVAASHAYTNCGVADLTNLITADRLAGTLNAAAMPPYSYTNVSVTNDTLAGQLGVDLQQALVANDKIKIYHTNAWNVYYLNSGWQWEAGIDPVTNLHINESMGMWIQRGAGVDSVAFYPYSNSPAMSENVFIRGTNDLLVLGWNLLASPFSDVRLPNAAPSYCLTNANIGDRIYIDGHRLYWSGSSWLEGSSNAVVQMTPGEAFWLYHKGTGFVWTVVGQ